MINNNELIDQIKSYNRFLNSESLNKAYNFALEAHQNQKRDEGVPYIIHPLAVAKILNCWPDLSIGPHRRGFDLTYTYKQQKIRIDVKSTKMNPGYLMAKPWRKVEDCDVYVHVSGTNPRYVIHGWAWAKELISPVNLSDMGFGKSYHMEPSQLREFNLHA